MPRRFPSRNICARKKRLCVKPSWSLSSAALRSRLPERKLKRKQNEELRKRSAGARMQKRSDAPEKKSSVWLNWKRFADRRKPLRRSVPARRNNSTPKSRRCANQSRSNSKRSRMPTLACARRRKHVVAPRQSNRSALSENSGSLLRLRTSVGPLTNSIGESRKSKRASSTNWKHVTAQRPKPANKPKKKTV